MPILTGPAPQSANKPPGWWAARRGWWPDGSADHRVGYGATHCDAVFDLCQRLGAESYYFVHGFNEGRQRRDFCAGIGEEYREGFAWGAMFYQESLALAFAAQLRKYPAETCKMALAAHAKTA